MSIVTILNAIRATATDAYQSTVPLATADNFIHVGKAVLEAPEQIQNEFFNALLNKIGLQIFNDKEFGNPLLFLKKGTLEYGQTIEDIFVEMARPFDYITGTREGEEDVPDQFAINKAIVDTAFYYQILGRQYFKTIHEQDLKRAFTSADGLGRLVSAVMLSIKNGVNYDDYRMAIAIMARQIEASMYNSDWRGHIRLIKLYNATVDESDAVTVEDCLSNRKFLQFMSNQFKKWSNRLTKPRKDMNNAGVTNWIPKEQQRIMMLGDIQADIDTNLMAWAYNNNRLEIGAIDEIDAWYSIGVPATGSTASPDDITVKGELGLEGEKPVVAVIYDPDMIKIYNKTNRVTTAINARGLYTNTFHTLEDIFACSPFHNFVVFSLS
jgi:hypothetical protein